MKTPKLTATQLAVLRDAKAGHVYRSERGHDLYACYDRAQRPRGQDKRVTAIVERLSTLGLLQIGERHVMQRSWQVTAQGEHEIQRAELTETK